MALLTDFVIASLEEADAVCRTSCKDDRWPRLMSKGLDNHALAELALALDLSPEASALETDELVIAMKCDEGPWVFHVPDSVRDHIAALDGERFKSVSEAWAKGGEMQFAGATASYCEDCLLNLQPFAARAMQEAIPLLLWMAL